MMKYADLQAPELDLLAGQPWWSTILSTVSSSSGDSQPSTISGMAKFQWKTGDFLYQNTMLLLNINNDKHTN